jgi:hypothetical protein
MWLNSVEVNQSGDFQLDRITLACRRTIEDALGDFLFCMKRSVRDRQTIDRALHDHAKHHQLFGLIDMSNFHCSALPCAF